MYRNFTGEAFTLLKENAYKDEEVKQLLSKCCIEYWEQHKAADPDNPIWQHKPQKDPEEKKNTAKDLTSAITFSRQSPPGILFIVHKKSSPAKDFTISATKYPQYSPVIPCY